MSWKIYHNPKCSKSRATLEILQQNDIEVEVIEYLKTPPSIDELKSVAKSLMLAPSDFVRKKEKAFTELQLENATPEKLMNAISENPSLLERPIVVNPEGQAVIGRPPENVLTLF